MNGRVPYATVSRGMTFIHWDTYRSMSCGFALVLPTNSKIAINEITIASFQVTNSLQEFIFVETRDRE